MQSQSRSFAIAHRPRLIGHGQSKGCFETHIPNCQRDDHSVYYHANAVHGGGLVITPWPIQRNSGRRRDFSRIHESGYNYDIPCRIEGVGSYLMKGTFAGSGEMTVILRQVDDRILAKINLADRAVRLAAASGGKKARKLMRRALRFQRQAEAMLKAA